MPLLIENNLTALCQRILVVDVEPQTQILRASRRDQNKVVMIENIMKSQVDRKTRLSFADDIVDNNGDLTETLPLLKQKVLELHHLYSELARK